MKEVVYCCDFCFRFGSPTIPAKIDSTCSLLDGYKPIPGEFTISTGPRFNVTFRLKEAPGREVYKLQIYGKGYSYDDEVLSGGLPLITADLPSCDLAHHNYDSYTAKCTVTFSPKPSPRIDVVMTNFIKYCKKDPGMLMTFKVGADKVKAVTNLMMSRSPVIDAMMRMDCVEAKTRIVKIKDFSVEVMQKFVEFCETDTVLDTEGFEMELCKIADKYDVKEMKEMAAELAYDSINSNSVVELFHFARIYNNKELEDDCIAFGRGHWNEIHTSVGVKNVAPDVLMEFWLATCK